MTATTTLGSKLRAARKKLGLTLEQLAERTNSSKSYIWELENKEGVNPSAEKISKIAKVLEITVEYLLNEDKLSPTISDIDLAFFRRFSELDDTKKEQIKNIIDILDKE